jgi:hypothetical protein
MIKLDYTLESPEERKELVEKILADEKPVFAQVYEALEYMLAPETVLLDAAKKRNKVRNKVKKRSAVRREVKSKLRSKKE